MFPSRGGVRGRLWLRLVTVALAGWEIDLKHDILKVALLNTPC